MTITMFYVHKTDIRQILFWIYFESIYSFKIYVPIGLPVFSVCLSYVELPLRKKSKY